MAELLWRDGNAWCDLTERAGAASTVTVVSQNATVVLLEAGRRHRYRRVPLEGGQQLPVDSLWLPFSTFGLTACGLIIDGAYPYRGTPLRAVLAGHQEAWLQTDIGHHLLREVMAGTAPRSPGHPGEPCGARHCRRMIGDNNLTRDNS